MTMQIEPEQLLRRLPQAGQLLERSEIAELQRMCSHRMLIGAVRSALDALRRDVRAGRHTQESLDTQLGAIGITIAVNVRRSLRPSLRAVINATGVILQTNLGRAPLSESALRNVVAVARGYCNLEVDLATGGRSRRDGHVERLILNVLAIRQPAGGGVLTGKAAAVVNNCAAACFLVLNTLAEGGEVIVSRGELVEIGGGFRVPEILRKSGAVLREVGTTNRTRVEDYAAAITSSTRLILRVHRSNFRIEGFTEQPGLPELHELGVRASLPVFEDQGTGCLVSLEDVGIRDESSWARSVAGDTALVACSGDKLLGGPQSGIVVGPEAYIERMRLNPLFRAMRVDKMTYAALEATLLEYLKGSEENLPAIGMMRAPLDGIRQRCDAMAVGLSSSEVSAEVVETRSVLGGGTTPGASLASFAVALSHLSASESAFAAHLRGLNPAVMVRASEGRVLLDLRTVAPADDALLGELIRTVVDSLANRGDAQEAV